VAGGSNRSNSDIVSALWEAFGEGRIDDVMELLHPEIEFFPMTRPGRSFYVGHEQTRMMLDDLHRAMGDFRIETSEPEVLDDGTVLVRGLTIREGTDIPPMAFESVIEFRDGLIARLTSRAPTTD
jgi:ketosteroid isomerase-like protein